MVVIAVIFGMLLANGVDGQLVKNGVDISGTKKECKVNCPKK
jgi:hypothetical protein